MLHARTLVLLEVRLDLALARRVERGLVHGEDDHLVVGRQHHRVEPGIDGSNVFGHELGKLVESGAMHQVIPHRNEVRHVADNVIHPSEPVRDVLLRVDGRVPRQVRPGVIPRHEPQHHVAVQPDLGDCLARRRASRGIALASARQHPRRRHGHAAVFHACLERRGRVLHPDAHGTDRDAVCLEEPVSLVLVPVRRTEHHRYLVALHDVTCKLVVPCALIRLCDQVEAQGQPEAGRGRLGVPAPELDVIEPLHAEQIRHRIRPHKALRARQLPPKRGVLVRGGRVGLGASTTTVTTAAVEGNWGVVDHVCMVYKVRYLDVHDEALNTCVRRAGVALTGQNLWWGPGTAARRHCKCRPKWHHTSSYPVCRLE